jgi:hypothetical protein
VPQKQPPSNPHPTLGFCSFLFLCQDGWFGTLYSLLTFIDEFHSV